MKPSQIHLSYVIPAHNMESYLAETLHSVLFDSFKRKEVIVVDDASTDRTGKILDYYANLSDQLKIKRFDKQVGRSYARNAGNEMARGDVICVLDADDVNHPERSPRIEKYFDKYPGTDLLYSDFEVMDVLGKTHGVEKARPWDYERVKKTLLTYIGHSSMAYRKAVASAVPYTDGEYAKNAIDDWKFQVDCHKRGFKFSVMEFPSMRYRYIPKERDEAKIKELKLCVLDH